MRKVLPDETDSSPSCENGPLRRELEAMIIHSMTRQRDILPSAISSFSESRREDGARSGELQSAFEQSYATYRSAFLLNDIPPFVSAWRERGVFTSKNRVRRLMKSHGLCPRQKRRTKVGTARSNPYLPVAPHLLLQASPAHKPDQRFYSVITDIPTHSMPPRRLTAARAS